MDISAISLDELKGITSKQTAALNRIGISTVMDLLLHFPHSYLDRTRFTPIDELTVDTYASIRAKIISRVSGRNNMLMLTLADDTGTIRVTLFNCPVFINRELKSGNILICHGKVSIFQNSLQMTNPELNLKDSELPETYTPIYRLTKGIKMQSMRNLIQKALSALDEDDACEELIPAELNHTGLTLREALKLVHAPKIGTSMSDLSLYATAEQQRVICEELISQYITVLTLKESNRLLNGIPLKPVDDLVKKFLSTLKFTPTGAQMRVFKEISADMTEARPMNRLVQGDVGCGKTLVAVLASLQAVGNGIQSAIMAPTEILAEQHYANIQGFLAPLGITAALLTGSQKKAEKNRQLELIKNGTAKIIVGTHAIFQEQVSFRSLGLIIIDEQHRFGVEQRMKLRAKCSVDDRVPHMLAMTATPIPRTLAQTIYADMHVSVIDELPKGRKPITTITIPEKRRDEIIERIGINCSQGKQAYWVCSLVNESEVLESQDAINACEYLTKKLPHLRIGLVHGQMKSQDKDAVMREFKAGNLDVLVATSVIEVGVDVPNAFLIVIENSERYGLAQLHQLRGRVGRGQLDSFCCLMYSDKINSVGMERLTTLRNSNDGFVIAQKDLEIRGPGDLLGTRQTGEIAYRVADAVRDYRSMDSCTKIAGEIYRAHPDLKEKLIKRWFPDSEIISAM